MSGSTQSDQPLRDGKPRCALGKYCLRNGTLGARPNQAAQVSKRTGCTCIKCCNSSRWFCDRHCMLQCRCGYKHSEFPRVYGLACFKLSKEDAASFLKTFQDKEGDPFLPKCVLDRKPVIFAIPETACVKELASLPLDQILTIQEDAIVVCRDETNCWELRFMLIQNAMPVRNADKLMIEGKFLVERSCLSKSGDSSLLDQSMKGCYMLADSHCPQGDFAIAQTTASKANTDILARDLELRGRCFAADAFELARPWIPNHIITETRNMVNSSSESCVIPGTYYTNLLVTLNCGDRNSYLDGMFSILWWLYFGNTCALRSYFAVQGLGLRIPLCGASSLVLMDTHKEEHCIEPPVDLFVEGMPARYIVGSCLSNHQKIVDLKVTQCEGRSPHTSRDKQEPCGIVKLDSVEPVLHDYSGYDGGFMDEVLEVFVPTKPRTY